MGEARTHYSDPSRHELAKRFLFFKGFLYGQSPGAIADTVLVGTRFGPSMSEWQQALGTVMSSSQSSPGNGFPGFTGSSEELTALMLRMTVPLPGILSLACALEGLNDWEVQHLLNVVGAGNAVAAFQDSEWEPVWKVVRAKLPPLLADAFDEHMHSTPQEACATRMAQTAILSVVTRVKRERFFMSKYLP
jgi:hypothetical protein